MLVEFGLADPVDGAELRHALRAGLDHRREVLVREDHVGATSSRRARSARQSRNAS